MVTAVVSHQRVRPAGGIYYEEQHRGVKQQVRRGGSGATGGFATNTAQSNWKLENNKTSQTKGPGIRIATVETTTAKLSAIVRNDMVKGATANQAA